MSSGAMHSNVGNPQVYNDGDQRTYTRAEKEAIREHAPTRYEAGQPNSHQSLDSKDERSIGNRLDAETMVKGRETPPEVEALKKDPRAPAMMHGNQPSRGAKVDAELKAEDEEQLRKKGKI